MANVLAKRMTAQVEGEFVVFLIGMRVNRFRKIHKWLPVVLAMPRMIRELEADPSSGFLGVQAWFGNPSIMVQYWRSQKPGTRRIGPRGSRSIRPSADAETWALRTCESN
jgi:hypothetical protein